MNVWVELFLSFFFFFNKFNMWSQLWRYQHRLPNTFVCLCVRRKLFKFPQNCFSLIESIGTSQINKKRERNKNPHDKKKAIGAISLTDAIVDGLVSFQTFNQIRKNKTKFVSLVWCAFCFIIFDICLFAVVCFRRRFGFFFFMLLLMP